MTERKTRADKGIVKITARDVEILTWIGEMYAVDFETLRKLLARSNPEKEILDITGVYPVVKRWQKLDLVEVRKVLADRPNYVWLTAKGLRELGLPYPYVAPRLNTVNHLQQVNDVRLKLEEDGLIDGWESERNYRHETTGKKIYPDGIAQRDGLDYGVEVQLVRKMSKTFDEKLGTLCKKSAYDFSGLWIYTTVKGSVVNAIERYVKKVGMSGEEAKKYFRIVEI